LIVVTAATSRIGRQILERVLGAGAAVRVIARMEAWCADVLKPAVLV
jgi:NAD(P)-dependent dehydrogenase (short-subunit alcohol dehydrogenase family)